MGGGMIQDRVGILAGGNLRFDFERFQIEDSNLGGSAQADKTNAEIGSYSDAMYAGRVRNVTNHGATFGIQHGDMCGACDVYAMSFWVDGDVVPPSAAFQRDFFQDFEFAAVVTRAKGAGYQMERGGGEDQRRISQK